MSLRAATADNLQVDINPTTRQFRRLSGNHEVISNSQVLFSSRCLEPKVVGMNFLYICTCCVASLTLTYIYIQELCDGAETATAKPYMACRRSHVRSTARRTWGDSGCPMGGTKSCKSSLRHSTTGTSFLGLQWMSSASTSAYENVLEQKLTSPVPPTTSSALDCGRVHGRCPWQGQTKDGEGGCRMIDWVFVAFAMGW